MVTIHEIDSSRTTITISQCTSYPQFIKEHLNFKLHPTTKCCEIQVDLPCSYSNIIIHTYILLFQTTLDRLITCTQQRQRLKLGQLYSLCELSWHTIMTSSSNSLVLGFCFSLLIGHKCSNMTKPHYEKCSCLKQQVNEEMVSPK